VSYLPISVCFNLETGRYLWLASHPTNAISEYPQEVADNVAKPTSRSTKAPWWRRASNKYDSPSKATTDTTYHDFEGLDDRVSRRDQRMASTSPHVPAVVDSVTDNSPEPTEVNPFPNGPTVSRQRRAPQSGAQCSTAERNVVDSSHRGDEPEAFFPTNPVSTARSRFSPNTDSSLDNDIVVPAKKQFLGGLFSKKSKNAATTDRK
jgi:hypothetical protein